MCQDEHENEDEDESFGWFLCIFNKKGDERTIGSVWGFNTHNQSVRLRVRFGVRLGTWTGY